jgi:hypothetical protein
MLRELLRAHLALEALHSEARRAGRTSIATIALATASALKVEIEKASRPEEAPVVVIDANDEWSPASGEVQS